MVKFDLEEVEAYKEIIDVAYNYVYYTDLTFFDIRQVISETFEFCEIKNIRDLKNEKTKDLLIETIKIQLDKAMKYKH
jgi:hypothetical protein